MSVSCDLLLLAAHPIELAGLQPYLGPQLCGTLCSVQLRCAVVGVGLLAAGVGAVQALTENACGAALLLGSYGYYPGCGGEVLETMVPTAARLLDGALLTGRAALPDLVTQRAEFDTPLTAGLRQSCENVGACDVATTLAITTDDTLAGRLAQAGLRGENLEALAVATACAVRGVRLACLLGATNQVGSAGRKQWLQHHHAVAERTAAHVLDFLACGAPGLVLPGE